MKVKDIMTANPACCTPESGLAHVASLQIEHDCGEIPVVEDSASGRPIGVITDRDITIRTVAKGLNPVLLTARDCMTSPVQTVTPETSLDDCLKMMEQQQIRRVVVVDPSGSCCGIVAQADIARHASKGDTAEVVREVSGRDA